MLRRIVIAGVVVAFPLFSLNAGAGTSSGVAFFETKIRPVLVRHCYECHSAEAEKPGGRLLLDTREGFLAGGESGAALLPGEPGKSLIMHALRWEHDLEMPPEEPLSERIIRDFATWISMGAPDPRTGRIKELSGKRYEEGALWSFEPITSPPPPKVKATEWPMNEIDHFTLAGMNAMGMDPVDDASPEMLIRRLYFDLTGLPPTMADVQLFLADRIIHGEKAVGRLVDQLLSSPQFGERWGRHWLDVARYAESNGNDGLSRNASFPHAWRYRDYVIDSFNRDTPYDRFILEQIAGDLLPAGNDEERDRNLIATGFLALGAKPAKAMNTNFEMDVVADQIDVIGSGILGLSVACARCHDHKFDPVPTRDYYAMAGFFTSTETLWGLAGNEKLTAPPTDLHVLKTHPKVTPYPGWRETVLVVESNTGRPKPVPNPRWEPGTPLAMGVRDRKEPSDCRINIKGDAKKTGESVPRGFLTAYEGIASISIPANSSGRVQLAEWLTDPSHPHTPRVMANRVWQHLFGRGIVNTPDDFGVYGEHPTHPELLDHLASRFVEDGWSVKKLIRYITLSRTYRLSSLAPEAMHRIDPENLWLARHNRRRLDAESLRDAMLSVGGQLMLDPPSGSPIRHRDILVNLAGESLHEPSRHRSIYLCYLRNSPPPELAAFDLPAFDKVTGKRNTSTIPGQALYLYNNPFVIEQAANLSERVRLSSPVPEDRVKNAFRIALNRSPDPEELYRALELLEGIQTTGVSTDEAWNGMCQSLLASNEFRYID